jgi:hypothetical protein
MGLDTKTSHFEDRVRSWLGNLEGEFDVIFACGDEKAPDAALEDITGRAKNIPSFRPEQLREVYQRLEIDKLVYGALFIRRHKAPAAKPVMARPRLSTHTDGACLEWFAGWHDWRSRDDIAQIISTTRPRLASALCIKSTYRVGAQGLAPSEFLLETDHPFTVITRFTDTWVVPLIAQLDGLRTVAEVHAAALNDIPPSFQLKDFVQLMLLLIERGYVEIPEWPLPALLH